MTRSPDTARVLMIANFLNSWDGRRSYAEDLILRLRAEGMKVIASSSLAFKPARLADMVLSATGSRGDFDVALVEVYSGQAFIWAETVGRVLQKLHRPLVLALHGGNLPRFAERSPRRVRHLLMSAARVVAPSSYLRDAFSNVRPDIELIPNAIDLASYPFQARASIRPRLFWLRAFHSMYQPAMAVRILAKLAAFHPDAHLTMAGVDKGDGSLQECERLASDLGVRERLTFAGVIGKSEVGASLSQADIFLNTTTVDNTPVSVLEAMACGLCIVSSNVGGVPHLVTGEEDALLFGPQDEDGMVAGVRRFLDEPALCQRLTANARNKALRCGWESVLPSWIDLLNRTARRTEVLAAC